MSLKLKTILTTAMLLASLAASTMPTAPASAASTEAISTGKTIAEANGIVLDSDADAAELAVLNNLNGGTLPEIDFEADGTVSHIDGLISGMTVRTKRDAKTVIASVADLLGIQDADAELSFNKSEANEFDTCFIFQQVYKGIRVANASVAVFADAQTSQADYLNSSFVSGLSVDTEPVFSASQVRTIVREKYGTGLSEEPQLLIVRTEGDTYKLAYAATATATEIGRVYIDAKDGSVLQGPAASYAASTTYKYNKSYVNPVTGTNGFTINNESFVQNGSTKYRLHDTSRNIYLIGNFDQFCNIVNPLLPANGDPTKPAHLNFLNNLQTQLLPSIRTSTTNSGTSAWNDNEIGILYQVERVHDFYKNRFNWNGTNGSGAALYVSQNTDPDNCGNCFAHPVYNLLEFGMANNDYYHSAKEIGVVAHEFTHRVLSNKIQWDYPDYGYPTDCHVTQGYIGEHAVLNEGYADVMGEYAQYYITGSMDWKNGNIINKNGAADRDYSRNAYYREYFSTGFQDHFYKATDNGGDTAHMEAHFGSTIISHIAYLMNQSGIYKDDAAKIWFNSISKLYGTNYSFLACRNAVISAANDVIDASSHYSSALARKKAKVKVHSAFNFAKIFPNSSYKIGDINSDGYVDVSDAVIVAQYAEEPNYWTANGRSPQNIAKGDVNYDGYITNADKDKILRVIARLDSFD